MFFFLSIFSIFQIKRSLSVPLFVPFSIVDDYTSWLQQFVCRKRKTSSKILLDEIFSFISEFTSFFTHSNEFGEPYSIHLLEVHTNGNGRRRAYTQTHMLKHWGKMVAALKRNAKTTFTILSTNMEKQVLGLLISAAAAFFLVLSSERHKNNPFYNSSVWQYYIALYMDFLGFLLPFVSLAFHFALHLLFARVMMEFRCLCSWLIWPFTNLTTACTHKPQFVCTHIDRSEAKPSKSIEKFLGSSLALLFGSLNAMQCAKSRANLQQTMRRNFVVLRGSDLEFNNAIPLFYRISMHTKTHWWRWSVQFIAAIRL